MIKEGKELNDVVCAAYRMGCEQTREVYQKRIEDLEASESEWQPICDSYAAENQRLSDRIVKLEAALREIVDIHPFKDPEGDASVKAIVDLVFHINLIARRALNTSAERVNEIGES